MATQDTLEASKTNKDKLIILLEKLHLDTFDDISDQIIAIMNFNASTTNTTWASAAGAVAQLIGNVLERVTDDVTRSETYACLCRKLMDNISPEIQDEIILTPEGRPIAGGQLFRKYLFWRLQEGVELGWPSEDRQGVKNLSDGTAITPTDGTVATASNVDEQERGATVELDSMKSHTLQKTKRQALDLITFAGELFVLQILAERPMHDFIRRLLNNAGSDTEDEFETLFKLLTTVGKLLETARGSPYMDVYISRMRSLADDPSTSARSKAILLVRYVRFRRNVES
jgi:translation initiation factor 4G